MIGEYDNSGNAIAEYVYFGLRPVAVKTGGNINIVHTDYLSTPRVVTSGGSVVWQWKNDNPYGNNLAQGSIEFNLRFAGQYYEYESGLQYNIHRTYDPQIGRYMQSDPIGLAGGFNTYNYVNRNPLDGVDPLGLDVIPFGLRGPDKGWAQNSSFYAEEITKVVNDQLRMNNESLILLAHGSKITLHGISAVVLAGQIISGQYINDGGMLKNDYFMNRLKSGKDIHIVLDACDTGIARHGMNGYKDGSSYMNDLASALKSYAIKNGFNNKIIIDAPSGVAIGISGILDNIGFRDFIMPDSRGDGKDSNGKWERIIK